jgi:hypothetical protein
MADTGHLLELLHPMREPPLPAPVTPFLVMVALGALAAVALAAAYLVGVRRRAGLRRAAAVALAASRGLAPGERLAAQANLLRRLVRQVGGEAEARTHGTVWLQTLDRVFATAFFTQGEGAAYGDALYAPSTAPDVDALDRALTGLIAKLPAKRAEHV